MTSLSIIIVWGCLALVGWYAGSVYDAFTTWRREVRAYQIRRAKRLQELERLATKERDSIARRRQK